MTDNKRVPGAAWSGIPADIQQQPIRLPSFSIYAPTSAPATVALTERERLLVVAVLRYVDGTCILASADDELSRMLAMWMRPDIAALLKRLSPEGV